MIAPTNRSATGFGYVRGERLECEICERTAWCFDRLGLVVCQTCQDDFLP